jgi:hypothetical protein
MAESPSGKDGFVRSMLGPQLNSAHSSAPVYGFGTSTREHREKTFVSPQHSKLQPNPKASPGPAAYGATSTLGKQTDGRLESSPNWVFGSGDRFGGGPKASNVGPGSYNASSSIGPQLTGGDSSPSYGMGSSTRDGVQTVYISEDHSNSMLAGRSTKTVPFYSSPTAVGKQLSSVKSTEPSWVFGKNKRFQDPELNAKAKIPAPGAHGERVRTGMGPQLLSAFPSAPLPGFGTSTRDHAAKLFMSPAHEKTKSYGKGSPGPALYLPPIAKRSAPSYGFGSCDRFYTRKMALRIGNTPGAAHYNV